MNSHLQIRLLTTEDLEFAESLRAHVGWNQLADDWRRLILYEPNGCFLGLWGDQPAATITTTTYGNDVAWIGMMLVHPDFRRRGIATALMNHALGYLRGRNVRCIKLDATADGQAVYERLGFQPEWEINRWLRDGDNRQVAIDDTAEDIASVATELDTRAFGCNRARWVERLAADSQVYLRRCDGWLRGYGLLRSGKRSAYLGPVVADDIAAGQAIVKELLGQHFGCVLWDIPEVNRPAVRLAEQLGFKKTRHLVRMWTGQCCIAGDPQMQFAIGDFATG